MYPANLQREVDIRRGFSENLVAVEGVDRQHLSDSVTKHNGCGVPGSASTVVASNRSWIGFTRTPTVGSRRASAPF